MWTKINEPLKIFMSLKRIFMHKWCIIGDFHSAHTFGQQEKIKNQEDVDRS